MKLLFVALVSLCACAASTAYESGPAETKDAAAEVAPAKRVFATRATYTGSLGGVTGADSICTAAAIKAGLGGKWIAWLSTHSTNAIERLPSDVPWYLVDGTTRVFGSKAAIPALPDHAIDSDEYGDPIPTTAPLPGDPIGAWTGTSAVGLSGSELCDDWTTQNNGVLGDYGSAQDEATKAWTSVGFAACSKSLHLYCFER